MGSMKAAGRGTGVTQARTRRERPGFDPHPYRADLVSIVREIVALEVANPRALNGVLRRFPKNGKGLFSRSEIIAGFRTFGASENFNVCEEAFLQRIQRRPIRSQSGVTPLTVLTKPFPCPGKCVYCPNDLKMPKSYLSDEPGAQRAANNRFDPYLQTWNRLAAFRATGHSTAKIELIVLGGTWSAYPEPYQIWFTKRCFEAMNDFGAGIDRRARAEELAANYDDLAQNEASEYQEGRNYNQVISDFLKAREGTANEARAEQADWFELDAVHRINRNAGCRNVGFSIETRPDRITPEEVLRIRRLGCTKVQIGIQSLSDQVLEANKRGHSVEDSRRALALLRRAGFKLHVHWMPNLLGSTPERDIQDFDRLFATADFRPDELKVYPCSLIESAELMRHYSSGDWHFYEHDELLEVVVHALEATPRYCRITRVIRDISSDDIVAGNKLTNFREIAQRELEARGGRAVDIRCREIRGRPFDEDKLTLRVTSFASSAGEDRFLEWVTEEDCIVAFLRLSLPEQPAFIPEIHDSALIREVHVYGAALEIGAQSESKPQHRGFGARLVEEAARIAKRAGFETLAVISAIGTHGYYQKLGFEEGPLYQHRQL